MRDREESGNDRSSRVTDPNIQTAVSSSHFIAMTDPFSCLDLKHVWHLARVLLPRRSQHGGWVWGLVWRRRDGERWHYKRWSSLVILTSLNLAVLAD